MIRRVKKIAVETRKLDALEINRRMTVEKSRKKLLKGQIKN